MSQILSIYSIERPLPAPARLVDSQPSLQEPQCRASPPTSKYFPSAPPWCWGLHCLRDRLTGRLLLSPQGDEQAAALAEKQNESPSRTDDEADLVARLESGTASSTDSEGGQSTDDGSESTTTGTGDDTSADSTATPSTKSKTPISTAPAAYTSAAFPTTRVTPMLPCAPTARTRWARRRSRSMNTNGPPKKDALRSSLNSTAWPHPQSTRLHRTRVARPRQARRYLAYPSRWMAPAALRLYSGPEPLQPLPPHRLVALRRKRQPQESPHRHASSQRDGHAAV